MDDVAKTGKLIHQWTGSWTKGTVQPIWMPEKRWMCLPVVENQWDIYAVSEDFASVSKLCSVYTGAGKEYAIILPNGKYAGTPGCESFLYKEEGGERMGMSALALWRNRPAEVLEAIGGNKDEIEALKETTKRWLTKQGFDPENMPAEPALKDFAKAEVQMPNLFAEDDSTTFQVKLKATAHDIKKLLIRADGVLIPQSWDSELEVPAGQEKEVTVEVPLASGQNWIEVTPVDSEGISGDTFRFRTICKVQKPSDLYVVTLGVSDYDADDLKLQYAAKDARDLAKAFDDYGVGNKHTLVLTDKEVKDSSVLDKVKAFLANAKVDDRVVLYVAGHGMLDDKLNYYYAPAGFDGERIVETGIPMEELTACLQSAQARRRLLLLDTCHSGTLGEEGEDKLAASGVQLPHGVRAIQHRGMKVKKIETPLSTNQKKRYIENVFSRGSTERGINIIAGAAGAEYAQESSEWNNGVFTCSIIQALRDAGSDLNGDKKVTVDEIQQIVSQKVSELTAGAQKPNLVASEGSGSFAIAGAEESGSSYDAPETEATAETTVSSEMTVTPETTPAAESPEAPQSVVGKTIVFSYENAKEKRYSLDEFEGYGNIGDIVGLVTKLYCNSKVKYKKLSHDTASLVYDREDGLVEFRCTLKFTTSTTGTATREWSEGEMEGKAEGITFTIEEGSGASNDGYSTDYSSAQQDNSELAPLIAQVEAMRSRDATSQLYQKRLLTLLPMIQNGAGVDVTLVETKGNSALHYACGMGYGDLVQWLVEHGADVNKRTNAGKTPLDCVGSGESKRIRDLLLQYGARRSR